MNKAIIGIVAVIVVVGGLLVVFNMSSKEDTPTTTTGNTNQTASNPTPSPASTNQTAETGQETAANDAQQTVDVTIQNYAYAPQKVTIKAGTTVRWINQDSVRHDVMPDTESADFKASELLGKGESYSFTFTKPGTYTYYCSPHPYMKATIEVTE